MDIPQIQSQLAINRRNINRLHTYIATIKWELKTEDVHRSLLPMRSRYIRTCTKKIAQLVVLQKALKKDISQQIKAERLYRDAVKNFFNTDAAPSWVDFNRKWNIERNSDDSNTKLP